MNGPCVIGSFSGFWGDSPLAAAQLVHAEERLDFLVGDYLAEVTMGILSRPRSLSTQPHQKQKPAVAYVSEFVDRVFVPLWPTLSQKGTRVVTNAGGLDPRGLREHLLRVCSERAWNVNVMCVYGDDVLDQV